MAWVNVSDVPEQSEDCYFSVYHEEENDDVIIEGNVEGLRFLAEVCNRLAKRTDDVDHDESRFPHTRLYQSQHLDENSHGECFNVTFYLV